MLRKLIRYEFLATGRIFLPLYGAFVLISLIIWLIMRTTVPIYHQAQNGLDRVTLLTRENYVGARVVRAFARQADELAAFVETNDHLKAIQWKAGRISAMMNPLTYLVVNLTVIALLLLGGREVNTGNLTQGEVIALINYMSQILLNLLRVADLVISVTRALASGMRVNEILNTKTSMPDPATAELSAQAGSPAVDFDQVSFTYRGAGGPSLTDIGFAAQPGETIGVIGGTGSGKTTLIDLVARFYDASEGTVQLFGHNVKEYSFAQLRRLIGIVPQQAMLFTGTIRDNMRWAAHNATDEEIWAALEIAQAADFVRGKPGQLDEPVETAGRNFSGGQRQRLTIARALVPKPKILILDDSASALDFATDAALRKALKEKTQGMTVFIVSQRAASVQRADHILVLDDGVLVGDAPHAQLLATCPVEIFYCGCESFAAVRTAALTALEALPRGELNFDIGTDVRMNAVEAEPRVFRETMDLTQGKLAMGWRLGECMEEPDPAALRVFNAVYGGTATSKLFTELREARSLCYYASSGVDDVKGLLYVHSGIDKANYDTAVDGIKAELDKVARGEISQDELDSARRYCAQALRLSADDPVELMMYYLKMNITGEEIAPDELAALCEGVSAGEVAEIARSCELDAVYFLSGEDEEAVMVRLIARICGVS